MKSWAPDHPKAGLMARKRAQILEASRQAFLSSGYEGSSMEAIAAAADVSVMTLYRHVRSKEELFAAVIASACDHDDEVERAEFAALLQRPTHELIVGLGIGVQDRLLSPGTIALTRAVMAEVPRFPELGAMVHAGFVGHFEERMTELLGTRSEFEGQSKAARRRLASRFIDQLVGVDLVRILLGLSGATPAERLHRAERATDELLESVSARAPRTRS